MTAPKVLTWDLETAPIESYHWKLWDENIGLEQIKVDWSILSYSAKWLGSKEVLYKDTGGRGVKKVRDDKALCKALWKLLDEADICVAQNGIRFDVKKLNARLALHGFGPYSPVRVVDTCQIAKKYFGFTSNKLAYLSQHLTETPKSEHKRWPGFSLWAECLKDNPDAWKEMKLYNVRDTEATEALYKRLLPWITNHPNVAAYSMTADVVCPKCSSPKLQSRGYTVTQAGKYARLHCQACGGWSRDKTNLLTADKRKGLQT